MPERLGFNVRMMGTGGNTVNAFGAEAPYFVFTVRDTSSCWVRKGTMNCTSVRVGVPAVLITPLLTNTCSDPSKLLPLMVTIFPDGADVSLTEVITGGNNTSSRIQP